MLKGMAEIDKHLARNIEFLDTINVRGYLQAGKDLYDIVDEIERDYNKTVSDDPILQGCVFNCMSTDEFADYITERFGIRVNEEVKVTYRIGGYINGINS